MRGCVVNPFFFSFSFLIIVDPFFSILVNNTCKGFFKSFMGLRPWRSFVSFLVLSHSRWLECDLRKLEMYHLVEGFIIRDNRIMVSHLQFVDDNILSKCQETKYKKFRAMS